MGLYDFDNDSFELRHNVGIDCVSLLSTDGEVDDFAPAIESEIEFITIISRLNTEREKLVAVCLANGIQKKDVAKILHIDPSRISRLIPRIKRQLQDVETQAKKKRKA